MSSADSINYCQLLKRKICRAYCMEIGDVRNDNMDIEHIKEEFDIDKANEIYKKCGWDETSIS